VAVAVAALLAGGLGAGLGVAFSSSSSSSGSGGSGTDALAVPSSTPKATKALSVAAIYKLVTPAVVDINTVIASPASQGTSSQAAGTGMIVSSNGLILTNNHVIKDATQIQVTISGRRTPYTATVVGTSVKNDIALLKVNGVSNLPTVSLGNSSTIAVGDTAVAVGNARGLGGSPSLAQGQISALGRTITAGDESSAATETLHNLIETNAQIQPGDSGGPLLDSKGQVIGMDTAASASDTSSATLGFAIPINQAKQIAVAIEEGKSTAANGVVVGLSPFLGVFESQGSALNPFGNFSIGGGSTQACATTTTVTGASISDVISNGPAANAGIAGGDTVTSVAGKQVTGWSSLASVVAGLHPGEKVPVTYADSCGTTHSTSVVIGGIPA
jgi:S1-C subfamily serine protease